jgi:hypothetical protein
MPTGYTAPVGDGKMTEFADYALNCARAFGALIMLRDSDQSLEATKRYIAAEAYNHAAEDSYHVRSLATAKTKVASLKAMTDEEIMAAAQAARDERLAANEQYRQEKALTQQRYEAMIAKVEGWEPPTEDHGKFKEFMLSQLTESISFDCGDFDWPAPELPATPAIWRAQQLAQTYQEIARAELSIAEEQARNEERRSWVTNLVESL